VYYQILNHLAHPPEYLLQENILCVNEDALSYYINNVGRKLNPQHKKYPRVALNDQLTQWLKDNITDAGTEYELSVSIIEPNVDKLLPHTDRARNYTLMYLLQGGGEGHRTVFYKHRDPHFFIERKQTFEYSDIVEVDSVSIPLRIWTILDAQQIHSVECIPDMRLALQISLEKNPWQHIV
jgi:hypothetical protein